MARTGAPARTWGRPFGAPPEEEHPMSTTDRVAPIVAGPGEGESLWAFESLALVKSTAQTTGGAVAVVELLAGKGSGSPLHVHTREDEWFYVIEGELTFWVGGTVSVAPAGSFVFGPKGIPHTFLVSSERARFLLVTEPAGFEGFMRAAGEPAGAMEIPPPPAAAPDMDAMVTLAAEYGIEIIGPPGLPS
jgi:quercetin dioxygenase-like cupin family protein